MFTTTKIDGLITNLQVDRNLVLSLSESSPILTKILFLNKHNLQELREELDKYFNTAKRIYIAGKEVQITFDHCNVYIPLTQESPILVNCYLPEDSDLPRREDFRTDLERIALKQIDLYDNKKWNVESFMHNLYHGWHGFAAYIAFVKSLFFILRKGLLKRSHWESIIKKANSEAAYEDSLKSFNARQNEYKEKRNELESIVIPMVEKMVADAPGWNYECRNVWNLWR